MVTSQEAERIAEATIKKLFAAIRGLPPGPSPGPISAGDAKITRFTVRNATNYENLISLPSDTAAWTMVNEGVGVVRWALSSNPPSTGDGSYATLLGRAAVQPNIIPAFLRKPLTLWFQLDSSSEPASDVIILYTTSTDPNTISVIAAGGMTFGIPQQDIEIGKVELKDSSGDWSVTVTSGPDGIKYIETDSSGSPVVALVSGPVTVLGSGGAIPIMLQDASGSQKVTISSGADGIKYIETDASGSVLDVIIRSRNNTSGADLMRWDASGAVAVAPGKFGVNVNSVVYGPSGTLNNMNVANVGTFGDQNTFANTMFGLLTNSLLYAQDGSNSKYFPVSANSGADGIVYLETDVSGSVIVAAGRQFGNQSSVALLVDSSGKLQVGIFSGGIVGTFTAISGNVGIASLDPGGTIANTQRDLNTAAFIFGADVAASRQLNVGAVYLTSGYIPNANALALVTVGVMAGYQPSVGSGAIPVAVNTSGQIYVTPVADPSQVTSIYSGVVSFGSGAGSGTISVIAISPPVLRPQNDRYMVDVYPNSNLSTDVRVILNRVMAFGSAVRRLQVGTFVVEKAGSGEANIVEGLFAGNVTGELLVRIETGAVENISAEVNVYRLA